MMRSALPIFIATLLCLPSLPASGQPGGREAESVSNGAAVCQSILVPSYFYPRPAGSAWETLLADAKQPHKAGRILLVNPNSGPGTAPNPDFQKTVTAAHKTGAKLYGYVSTRYGAVPIATVQTQILDYIAWYGIDGIFVDEVSSEAKQVSAYYQPVATFITAKIAGGGVILNNGIYPDQAYAEIKVPPTSKLQLVLFEDSYATFTGHAGVPPAWISHYPASMFIDIVHTTPADKLADVLRLSAQRNAGWVYVTDKIMPNPYNALPSYWSSFTRATQAGCAK